MDWKKEAINDLMRYRSRCNSITSMLEKIQELDSKVAKVNATSNAIPVQGGGNRIEDRIVNYIAEKEKLQVNVQITRHQIAAVERGLSFLSEDEKRVLTLFYIDRPSRHIDRLCDELHYEKSRIYQIKDSALYRFTVAMYGVIDV